ncbi:MAG: HlyD family type I secretion periplasmic adaptor subunit [Pseudomonadota bacterium]
MSETAISTKPAAVTAGRRFAFPTQTTFLSQAALLEEAGPPRAPAMACLLGFAFVATAVVAGALVEVDVVTSSTGKIVASAGSQILQSFEGGIVDRIEVEEGQVVDEGDLLLILKDPEGEAQIDRLTHREAALFAQVRRLQSLVDLPLTAAIRRSENAEAVAEEQMRLLRFEQEALASERALVQAEIDRRSEVLANARSLEKNAAFRLSLLESKLDSDRQLHALGLLPKTQLIDVEQQVIDAASELKEIQGQIREAETGLAESERRLESTVASRMQRQSDQLSSAMMDLNETRQQIDAMEKRLERGRIVASSRGVVMELKVRHPGQTIAPGDPIVEIIPLDGGLDAEARLPTSEVSHVQPGQAVRIAIDGIEPHRHGYLEGSVESVSPSTFIDENAMPYYRASISLAHETLDDKALTPGMTLQAQIKTGRRTLLEYLLKPVYRAWDTAFRER